MDAGLAGLAAVRVHRQPAAEFDSKDCRPGSLPGTSNGPVFASCTVQQILIIDPAIGLPMAEELRYPTPPDGQQWTAPDGLFSYEIFGQSYWTDQNPPKPASPRR